MALSLQPFVEQPNLRQSIALIVDDPAPCINPLWWHLTAVHGEADPRHERTIPIEFMEEWCRWTGETGVRGEFTVMPYPAGLGRIDQGLRGCDRAEVRAWVELARRCVAPQFDIHCEVLTHTRAVDLATWELLPLSERQWMEAASEEELAAYFSAAMRILKDAGLPNNGVTQPWTFTGDESMYARAILRAEREVNDRKVCNNFIHVDSVGPYVPPRLTLLDEARGEAVASIWAATTDYVWNTQERDHADAKSAPEALADRFVTEDGLSGRLPELRGMRGPMVLVTHWQSLYSNGSRLGLATFREVERRVAALWRGSVQWRKLSELSGEYLAMQTARFESQATSTEARVKVSSPFAATALTFTVATVWPLYQSPVVYLNGVVARQVDQEAKLEPGAWMMRGSTVTISTALAAGVQAEVRIVPTKLSAD